MNTEIDRYRALDDSVTAASEFLHVPRGDIFELAKAWATVGPELWAKTGPDTFYASWTGAVGASAISANIIDQLSRVAVWNVLHQVFSRDLRWTYLDYGCGTAAVSFPFLSRCEVGVLLDVANANQEFVAWRLQRHGLTQAAVLTPDKAPALPAGSFNFVTCVDVLEHLTNPSEVFAQLDRLLQPEGLLLLRAPWAREDEDFGEHLAEAPLDWHRSGGGADSLAAGFSVLAELADGGLYQKRR